jgi:hypothetical protein
MESGYPLDAIEDNEGKFNMGIRTLIRIDEIIFEINSISANPNIDKGKGQHTKLILVKQLQIRAAPLMPAMHIEHDSSTGKIKEMHEQYDPEVEKLLDDLVEEIELSLQKEGCYFMPNKSEQALF